MIRGHGFEQRIAKLNLWRIVVDVGARCAPVIGLWRSNRSTNLLFDVG